MSVDYFSQFPKNQKIQHKKDIESLSVKETGYEI